MKRAATVAVFALAAVASQARASDKDRSDGNALLEWCSAVERTTEGDNRNTVEENVNFFQCLSYMDGVLDMLAFAMAADGKDYPICLPEHATRGQSARIVVVYLRNHPEQLHMNGSMLVSAALYEAYPCEKKTRTSSF